MSKSFHRSFHIASQMNYFFTKEKNPNLSVSVFCRLGSACLHFGPFWHFNFQFIPLVDKKSGFDEEEMLEAMMADMMLGGKSKGAKASAGGKNKTKNAASKAKSGGDDEWQTDSDDDSDDQ